VTSLSRNAAKSGGKAVVFGLVLGVDLGFGLEALYADLEADMKPVLCPCGGRIEEPLEHQRWQCQQKGGGGSWLASPCLASICAPGTSRAGSWAVGFS